MNLLENREMKFDNFIYGVGNSITTRDRHIKFTDEHLLKPSLFPNGSVCGHLHEIRSINFTARCTNNYCRKINIKPVNLKMKAR